MASAHRVIVIIANALGRTCGRQRHADAGGRRRLVAHRLAGRPSLCPSARPRSSRGHAAACPGRCAAAGYGRPRPGGVMPPAKSAAPGACGIVPLGSAGSCPPCSPNPPMKFGGGVGLRRERRQAAVAALRHVFCPPPSPPLGGLQPPPPPSRGSGGWASCRAVGRPVRPPRSLAGRQCPRPSALGRGSGHGEGSAAPAAVGLAVGCLLPTAYCVPRPARHPARGNGRRPGGRMVRPPPAGRRPRAPAAIGPPSPGRRACRNLYF